MWLVRLTSLASLVLCEPNSRNEGWLCCGRTLVTGGMLVASLSLSVKWPGTSSSIRCDTDAFLPDSSMFFRKAIIIASLPQVSTPSIRTHHLIGP